MRMIRYAAPMLLILLAASAVAAQPFWEKKAYTEWSKGDCRKMLEDSPWAKKFVISSVQQDRFGQPTRGESRQTEQKITYVAQLRGAPPVRQAVVRLAALNNDYDKMPPETKKVFDESSEAYLNGEMGNRIIVHVEFSSNVQFYEMELVRYWHSYPRGTMPRDVWLTTSSGKRIEAHSWKVEPGGAPAFEFYFPREVEGVPVIPPTEDKLYFEFPNPRLRDLNDTRARFEFQIEKMKYKGELVF